MKKEFILSDKGYNSDEDGKVYQEEDVKEAIKRLKQKINTEISLKDNYSKWGCDSYQIFGEDLIDEINKIFGDNFR